MRWACPAVIANLAAHSSLQPRVPFTIHCNFGGIMRNRVRSVSAVIYSI